MLSYLIVWIKDVIVRDILYGPFRGPTSKGKCSCHFRPMLGMQFHTTAHRWRRCCAKKIIVHDLDILEGVWGQKDRLRAHFYLTNINLDVGHQCLEGF